MPAYLIVRANVTDMEQYQQYMQRTPAIVKKYGGEYIVRAGEKVVLEGPDVPERVVVIRFPDIATARSMYDSDEYQAAMKLRLGAADASFIVVDGVDQPG